MPEQPDTMEWLARQVRSALEAADLSAYAELLDPGVHWGAPDARVPACRNRDQVLAWYRRGREAGTRATVSEVTVLGDRILVGMAVGTAMGTAVGTDVSMATGSSVGTTPAAGRRGEVTVRWQVLTVKGGRIVDIVGFDSRSEALSRAGAPPSTQSSPPAEDSRIRRVLDSGLLWWLSVTRGARR